MKTLLSFLFSLTVYSTWACGPMMYEEDLYYNLLHQEVLADKSFTPFHLFFDGQLKWDDADLSAADYRIFQEWSAHFDHKVSPAGIQKIMGAETSILEKMKKRPRVSLIGEEFAVLANKKHQAFWEYLAFARACDALSQKSYNDIWEEPESNPEAFSNLMEKAFDYWNRSDDFYKARYGFQLMKLNFFGNGDKNQHLFEKYVEPFKKDEAIYFYSLDFYASDVFSTQHNKEKAAFHYLTVFNEVPEKRRSAYLSFSFMEGGLDWKELYAMCETTEEKAAYIFLRSFLEGSSPVKATERVYDIDPNSKYLQPLAARSINSLERVFNRRTFYDFQPAFCSELEHFPETVDTYDDEYLASLLEKDSEQFRELVNDALNNPMIQDKDKWLLIGAQVAFLDRDTNTGLDLVQKASISKNVDVQQTAKLVQAFLEVAHLGKIDSKAEETLLNSLEVITNSQSREEDGYYNGSDNLVLFWEIVHEIYTQEGDFTRAYLSLNSLRNQEQYQERCLLETLEIMYSQPMNEYSDWTQSLLTRHGTKEPLLLLKDYLATTYIHELDVDKALEYYEEIQNSGKDLSPIKYFDNIPDSVFYTNRTTCYECESDDSLIPEKLKKYKFISPSMTKYELTLALKQLEKKSAKDPFAAYLLGNFYFNINSKGYYRELFSYANSNGYNDDFEPELLAFDGSWWNPNYGYHVLPIDHLETQKFYKQVLQHKKSSRELKAKAVWGIIQMQQGEFEQIPEKQEEYWGFTYDYEEVEVYQEYISDQLETLESFSDTEFYDEIIHECMYLS